MRQNTADWALLPTEAGKGWVNLSRQDQEPVSLDRPPSRALYAIPTYHLVASTKWVNSTDESLISDIVSTEAESLGSDEERPGYLTDWSIIDQSGSQSLVQTVSIPWELPNTDQKSAKWAGFVPLFDLLPPPPDSIVLWQEGERWTMGFSQRDKWVNVQNLGASSSLTDLVQEVRLATLELLSKSQISAPLQLVVWEREIPGFRRVLEAAYDIPVHFVEKPKYLSSSSRFWKFCPDNIATKRQEAKNNRRQIFTWLMVILLLCCVGALGYLHLQHLESKNDILEGRVAENREAADAIEQTIEQWNALGPAIDSRRSPLEVYHNFSSLLPDKGFRITSFEFLNNRTAVIRGEADSTPSAIKIKDAVASQKSLQDYEWDLPQPTPKGDVSSFFAQGTYRYGIPEISK